MKWLLLFILINSCSQKKISQSPVPEAKPITTVFEVTDNILHPESVLYSKTHQVIFVTNIASGNPLETKAVGYISKISIEGKVIKSKWIEGLKAPKGMAIFNDFLYVADVNELVEIDIKKEKIVKKYKVKGATFLNDVTSDNLGTIYFSDMFENKIHMLKNKKVSVISNNDMPSPNGLKMIDPAHLIIGFWGNDLDKKTFQTKNKGGLVAVDLKQFEVTNEDLNQSECRGNLDGVDTDSNGNLWVSDWVTGDVYKVLKNGKTSKEYNFGQGTADISIAKELGLLLIPQMAKNKIIAIKF